MMRRMVLPPTVFIVSLLLTIMVHFIFSIWKIISTPIHYTGIALFVLGTTLNIWADRICKNEETAISPYDLPTAMVTSGPFRFSRNPMYLGMVLIVLGLAVFLRTAIPFVVTIALAVFFDRVCIRHEESAMEKEFGKGFLDCRKRVRRWI